MNIENKIKVTFNALSVNEGFARGVIGLFAVQLNPSVAELSDIKTAVSEAVTNCIVHAYPDKIGVIDLEAYIENNILHINVFDYGVGIENLEKALEPFYSTKLDEERSGMGFTIMQSFMDEISVKSKQGEGTHIYMSKKLCR